MSREAREGRRGGLGEPGGGALRGREEVRERGGRGGGRSHPCGRLAGWLARVSRVGVCGVLAPRPVGRRWRTRSRERGGGGEESRKPVRARGGVSAVAAPDWLAAILVKH